MKQVKENLKAVATYASASDYDKLVGYKNYECGGFCGLDSG